jgi:hypothetical protein
MRLMWHIAGLVFVIAFAIGSNAVLAEPLIGTVVQKSFKGAVGTRAAATSEPLYFGHEVYAQETVTTPANGATVMRFHDQTQLQIGANSTIVLDRFVYDPNVDTSNGSIKFAKGVFRYIGGQAKSEDNIKLSTPTTTLTIRGTKFIIYVADDGGTTVSVIDGKVDVQPCGPGKPAHADTGQTYHVSPSCEVAQAAFAVIPADPAVESDYDVTAVAGGSLGVAGGGTNPPGGGSPPGGGGGSGGGGFGGGGNGNGGGNDHGRRG